MRKKEEIYAPKVGLVALSSPSRLSLRICDNCKRLRGRNHFLLIETHVEFYGAFIEALSMTN